MPGSNGRDETPAMPYNPRLGRWMPDRSATQRQVGLAAADNCWRYFEAAGDQALLLAAGAGLIFEVARRFAYLAAFDEALGRVSRGNPRHLRSQESAICFPVLTGNINLLNFSFPPTGPA